MEKEKINLSVQDLITSIETMEELSTTIILWCGLLREFLSREYGIKAGK